MFNVWFCTFWMVTCQGQGHQLRSRVNNIPLNEELDIMTPYLGYIAAMLNGWIHDMVLVIIQGQRSN